MASMLPTASVPPLPDATDNRAFRQPRTIRVLLLGAVIAAAWQLLGMGIPGPSERFYLLLPPGCAAVIVFLSAEGWRGLRPYLRRALNYVACLALLLLLFRLVVRFCLLPSVPDAMPRISEFLICLYFVAALSLLIFLFLGLLRALGCALDGRLFGRCPEPPPRRRLFLRHDLPTLLLLPLCFPVLMAALYVHRAKSGNVSSPTTETGRAYEDVAFVSSDGLTLRGWFLPANAPSERTLLMCHGLGGTRSDTLHWSEVADVLQANILTFDFRGHGDSDGHTVTFGCHEKRDVLAAIAYLRTQRPEQARQIVGLGFSMGAAALALAAAEVEPPLNDVILDSCFMSAVGLTDTALAGIPTPLRRVLVVPGVPLASLHAGCDLRTARPIDVIDRIRAPLLLIHADGDTLIPVENSRELFERAAEPKSLWIAHTGDHCSAIHERAEYLRRCRELVGR